MVSTPVVVMMVIGAKAGSGVNPGGVINPDNGDGVVGLPVLTDERGLVSSIISNDKSLVLL